LLAPYCRTPFPTSPRKFSSSAQSKVQANKTRSVQITAFVEGLFTLNTQYDKFRLTLRDFLISLREFAGDNTELYLVEKEQQERDAQVAERERRSKVSGLLKPSELEDDEL
jgi:exportin-1